MSEPLILGLCALAVRALASWRNEVNTKHILAALATKADKADVAAIEVRVDKLEKRLVTIEYKA